MTYRYLLIWGEILEEGALHCSAELLVRVQREAPLGEFAFFTFDEALKLYRVTSSAQLALLTNVIVLPKAEERLWTAEQRYLLVDWYIQCG